MKNKPFGEAPLLRLAVCLMAGIVVGDNIGNCDWLLPAFVVMVVGAMLLWRYAVVQSAAIAACFVLLGWLLVQRQEASLRVTWPEQEVVYEAVVLSEPVEKAKTMAVDILLAESGRKLKCYFYKERRREGVRREGVRREGDRSGTLRIGDGLRIQSRIRPNSEWRKGSFDSKRYLEVHGFSGQTFVSGRKWQKAQVSLRSLSRLERTKLYFLKLRSRLLARIMTEGADGDAVAVVAAMALGDKSALSQDLREVYSVTGASHVLALSGLHLGIIYMLLTFLFGGKKLFTFSPLPPFGHLFS